MKKIIIAIILCVAVLCVSFFLWDKDVEDIDQHKEISLSLEKEIIDLAGGDINMPIGSETIGEKIVYTNEHNFFL